MKDEVNFNVPVHSFKRVPKPKPLMMCCTFEHARDAQSCYFMQKVGCIV